MNALTAELLRETIDCFEEQGRMCRAIIQDAAAVGRARMAATTTADDREKQVLYTSTWLNRPSIYEHRLKSLQEVLRIELDN